MCRTPAIEGAGRCYLGIKMECTLCRKEKEKFHVVKKCGHVACEDCLIKWKKVNTREETIVVIE